MAYGSAIPEARDQILTELAARSGLSGVSVSKNPPLKPQDLKSGSAFEAIFVGRLDGQSYQGLMEVPSMTGGTSSFEDQFTLWLTVQVSKATTSTTSDTEQTTSDRAWTLAAEIVAEAQAGHTMGVSTSSTLLKFWVDAIEYDEQTSRLDRGGAVTFLSLGLRCNARKLLA
jgi:hypothetical protein